MIKINNPVIRKSIIIENTKKQSKLNFLNLFLNDNYFLKNYKKVIGKNLKRDIRKYRKQNGKTNSLKLIKEKLINENIINRPAGI